MIRWIGRKPKAGDLRLKIGGKNKGKRGGINQGSKSRKIRARVSEKSAFRHLDPHQNFDKKV